MATPIHPKLGCSLNKRPQPHIKPWCIEHPENAITPQTSDILPVANAVKVDTLDKVGLFVAFPLRAEERLFERVLENKLKKKRG